MVSSSFLDNIIDVLNSDNSLCTIPLPSLRQIKTSDEDQGNVLRFLIDSLNISWLSINHSESPNFINRYKEAFPYKAELEYMIQRSQHYLLNAVMSEFLWVVDRKHAYAVKAVNAYFRLLLQINENAHDFCAIACAICRIYSKCRNIDFDKQQFSKLCLAYAKDNLDSDGYLDLFVLLGLLECRFETETVEQFMSDSILYFQSKQQFIKAIGYRDELIEAYKKAKRPFKHLYIDNAYDYEVLAKSFDPHNPENAIKIIGFAHKSMACWEYSKHSDASSNRKRLALFLRPIKESISYSMIPVSSPPIDLSTIIHSIENEVSKSSFKETIRLISSAIPLKGFEFFDQSDKSVFSSLFPARLLDNKGRIQANIPAKAGANAEDRRKIAHHEASNYYSIVASLLLPNLLTISKKKYVYNAETLRFLVDDNILIPVDRHDSFLKGIVSGFSGDYVTALHILMPQIENAVRVLAETCDIVTYKTGLDGVEACLSLTSILLLEEFKEMLEDDLIFNMEVFYTSTYGFGMRDLVCHGLLSDSSLNSNRCMTVWWFTFHLCCLFCPSLFIDIHDN